MTKSSTQLSGVLNIDKPAGLTSHDAVSQVRRLTGIRQVGHAGTLDPFATGVLIVAVGSATRLLEYVHVLPKTYEAAITLGATSDTDDSTGKITKSIRQLADQNPKQIPITEIQKTLQKFIGHISQLPPAYAAIKIKGKKLYEYARAGESVERTPRTITIHSIELLTYEYPTLHIRVSCSTGTYVRALARDIGEALKTDGYCETLRRTAIGPFDTAKSISLKDFSTGTLPTHLLPPEALVAHLPRHYLAKINVAKFRQGQAIEVSDDLSVDRPIAIFDDAHHLIGIGQYHIEKSLLSPLKVL